MHGFGLRLSIGALLALGLPAATVWAQTDTQSIGDPLAGASLAQLHCSNCHVVAASQRTAPTVGAPTFHAIAANPDMTATAIRVFIEIPHPRMANQMLSRAEIGDITAYILSLRAK